MARALWRAWHHDLLARRAELAVHPLSTQVAFVIGGGLDDRGRDPSLHRDGGRSTIRRLARAERDRLCLLQTARVPATATAEIHSLAKTVSPGNRQGRCVCEPATDPEQAHRLGFGASTVRSDDQVHHCAPL